jgi:hypothetical protein
MKKQGELRKEWQSMEKRAGIDPKYRVMVVEADVEIVGPDSKKVARSKRRLAHEKKKLELLELEQC